MHRIFLFALALFIPFTSFSQNKKESLPDPELPVDEKTGMITYKEVVEAEGESAEALFSKALSWANGYYKNPGNVIRKKDKASGSIVIKARYRLNNPPDKKGVVTSAGDAMYTLKLDFKDGRYRYHCSNINWMRSSAFPGEKWMDESSAHYKPVFKHYLASTDEKINEVIQSLKESMANVASSDDDDW